MVNPIEAQKPVIVGVHIDPDGRYLRSHANNYRSVSQVGSETYAQAVKRVAEAGAGFLLIPFEGINGTFMRQTSRGPYIQESETIFVDGLEQEGVRTAILPDTLNANPQDAENWPRAARRRISQALASWGVELNSQTQFILIGAFFDASIVHAAIGLLKVLEEDGVTSVQIDPSASLGKPNSILTNAHDAEVEYGGQLITVRRARK